MHRKKEFCINYDEMKESLKNIYKSYKKSIEDIDINDNKHSIYLKGFCYAIERILEIHGKLGMDEIEAIKMPILGKISMENRQKENLDKPTYKRKGIDIKTKHNMP